MKQRKYFSEIKTGYKVGSPKEKPFGKPEIRGLIVKFVNFFSWSSAKQTVNHI